MANEQFDIKSEIEEISEGGHSSFTIIPSTQQISSGNTSIEPFSLNDDDFVIPETQDILSQDSELEVSSKSCSIIDCEKSEYSFQSKDVVAIEQNGKPNTNMSVVSISSDEGQDESQVESIGAKTIALSRENEVCHEKQENVEVKDEVNTSITTTNGEQSDDR